MKGFSGATVTRGKSERLSDLVDVIEWPEGEYMDVRMIGPVFAYKYIWFTIKTAQKAKQPIPKLCIDHDGENDKPGGDTCPYRKSGLGREAKQYAVNVIVRDLQMDEKGRVREFPKANVEVATQLHHKAYWAKKGDTRKTPVRILLIPDSQVAKLQQLQKLNRVKTKDGTSSYELSDSEYGCDIQIMIDPNKKGAAKFDIQKGDRTPITAEEKRYLLYRPDSLKPEPLDRAKSEMRDLEGKIVPEDEKDGKRRGSSKSSRPRDEDDDEDSGIDDDKIDMSDDEMDDERPAKKSKRRVAEDDEDDDDRPAKKKKRSHDEDEEEEEDERSSKKKKRPADEDEDEDDLDSEIDAEIDGDLEDEEDERPSKKKKRPADEDEDEDERPNKSKRRPADEDEDDEDEDEAPRKRRSR